MSDIQALFERLNGIEATIAEATRSVDAPLSDGARAMIASLERRRDELREMAEAYAEDRLVDVCDYRILPSNLNFYPVKAVAESLSGWQDAVTSFFAAIRDKKPRARAVYSPEIVAASTLNFGYSYPGSLGLVMYIQNDQLFNETDLDLAVSGIMRLVDTETVADVRDIAETFGKAAVQSFYSWSKTHTDADLSADIKWQRGKEVKFERCVQPAGLERVQGIIKVADSKDVKIEQYDGVLVALNITGQGSFKMSFADPSLRDISGKFGEEFDSKIPHEVPARYAATLRRTLYTSLWSTDEHSDWELVSLDPMMPYVSN